MRIYVSCMLFCHPSGSSYAADADECSKVVQLVLHVQVYITSCLLACSQLPVEVYNISQKVCAHSLPSSHSLYCTCAIPSCAKHVAQYAIPGGMFPTSCSTVTYMCLSFRWGHLDVAKALIGTPDCNMWHKDREGRTPLQLAWENRYICDISSLKPENIATSRMYLSHLLSLPIEYSDECIGGHTTLPVPHMPCVPTTHEVGK